MRIANPPPAARIAILAALLLPACGKRPEGAPDSGAPASSSPVSIAPQGKVLEAAENESPDAGLASAAKKAAPSAAARERVQIPAGGFTAGSTPGDKGRDPVLEPTLLAIELGGFSIDKYLYPNDPQKPPLTGVPRARASELCQEAGGRLCTELEWERACKGQEGTAYAGSSAWDPACARAPASCASGFGTLGMGAALREWTASDVAPIENVQPRAAAVRGARGDAGAVDHRCAHRAALDAASGSEDLGFRCCYGPPNAASIPAPQWQQTFRKAELTPSQAEEMFASVPQLKELHEIAYFKEPDDVNLVLSRGDAGAGTVPNTSFTTQPVLWNPIAGEEILVVAGKAQKHAFIVAFYRLPGDRYRIASSFIMNDERGPIVLAYNNYVRKRMSWSACWDCRGESGNVTYRDDNRVVITQK
jgi:formylglycine-generating enzyme required for sulfatase activity